MLCDRMVTEELKAEVCAVCYHDHRRVESRSLASVAEVIEKLLLVLT